MHWKILDLDPALATERDVKRAYARRLKNCRPDQDPEGFRSLHDAYQTALGEIQWRSRSGHEMEGGASDGSETLPKPENGDIPPVVPAFVYDDAMSPAATTLLDALERLEKALIDNQPGVGALVREAEKALFKYPEESARWGNFIANLISRYGKRADFRIHPEALIVELEHHCLAATFAIIDRLDLSGNSDGIAGLAMRLLEQQDRIRTTAGAIAAARLACVAAFWSKDCVSSLADFAYANLARGERDFYMGHIDRHLAIGNLLETVPDAYVCFWRQRLIDNSAPEEWETEAARSALRWLYSSAGGGNAAAEVLRGLVPENAAEKLLGVKFQESDSFGRAGASSQTASPNSETSGGGQTFSWESKGGPRSRPRQVPDWEINPPGRRHSQSQGRTPVDLGFLRFLIFPFIIVIGKMLFSLSDSSSYTPVHKSFDSTVPFSEQKFIPMEDLSANSPQIKDWQRNHPPIIDSGIPAESMPKKEEQNPLYQFIKSRPEATK